MKSVTVEGQSGIAAPRDVQFVRVATPQLPSVGERGERVLVVGTGARAARLVDVLRARRCVVVGAVDDSLQPELAGATPQVPWLGGLDRLTEAVLAYGAEQICVAMPLRSGFDAVVRARQVARRLGVPVVMALDVFDGGDVVRVGTGADGTTLEYNFHRSRRWHLQIAKRLVDVGIAALALIVLAPLLCAAALCIAVTMGRPIFFLQDRVGLNRRRFRMIKFRTMVVNDDQGRPNMKTMDPRGVMFKAVNDVRVTPVGAWLRKTSIDELPQLLNVLKGEMSLVGPRPLPIWVYAHVDNFDFHRRFSVLPGMTGAWQVSGRVQDFGVMMDHDLRYVDEWSVAGDLRILARTPLAVIRGSGAS